MFEYVEGGYCEAVKNRIADEAICNLLYTIKRKDHINKILQEVANGAGNTAYVSSLIYWFLLCTTTIREDEFSEGDWKY